MKKIDCSRDAVAIEYRPYFHQALLATVFLMLVVGFQGVRLGIILPLDAIVLAALIAMTISGLLAQQPYSSIIGAIVFIVVGSIVVISVSRSTLSFEDFADGDDMWFLPLLALGTFLSRGLRDIVIALNLVGVFVVFLTVGEQIVGRDFTAVNMYTLPVTCLHFFLFAFRAGRSRLSFEFPSSAGIARRIIYGLPFAKRRTVLRLVVGFALMAAAIPVFGILLDLPGEAIAIVATIGGFIFAAGMRALVRVTKVQEIDRSSKTLFLRGFSTDEKRIDATFSLLEFFRHVSGQREGTIESCVRKVFSQRDFHAFGLPLGRFDPLGVIPPFLAGCGRRTHAAIFSFMAGVIPPMPMFGRSLL